MSAADANSLSAAPLIWIDGDACPRPVKQLVMRTGQRRGVGVRMVCAQTMNLPEDGGDVELIIVDSGADAADKEILERMRAGDLTVTADIPLADAVVKQGGVAIDPRGQIYDAASIGEKLATRNLMQELRSHTLEQRGGPPPYVQKDFQRFANALDRLLTKMLQA
ncbi:YaiI/YqxD family protein [Candidatus Sumerlaeota bacterium]|nr:YaiI/YqxD family protein [Candidatus Sumerlaeota bacterium]